MAQARPAQPACSLIIMLGLASPILVFTKKYPHDISKPLSNGFMPCILAVSSKRLEQLYKDAKIDAKILKDKVPETAQLPRPHEATNEEAARCVSLQIVSETFFQDA